MGRTERSRFRRRAAPALELSEAERQSLADELTAWWLDAEHVLEPGDPVDGRASAVRERYSLPALTARLGQRRPELAVADEAALRTTLTAFVSWTLSYEARQLKVFLRQRAGLDGADMPVDLPPALVAELRNEARSAVAAVERRPGTPDPYGDVRRELAGLAEQASRWQSGGPSATPLASPHGGSHGAGHHGHAAGGSHSGGGPS
jgi:hypothetical protein